MAKLTGQQLIAKAGKLHSTGKFSQAEKIYKQLLRANPNDLTLLRVLGILERDRRNLKASVDWFVLARQISGNDPVILAELALTLEQAGKSEKAMEIASEAHSTSPTDLAIAIFYAKICLSRGLGSKAGAALERAIDSDTNNPEAWHLLAMAANSSGTLPVPLHFAKRAIQLKPKQTHSHATLATAYRLNGDLEEALASYERALSIDSTFPEAIAGKAEVLVSLNRTQEANELLCNAPQSDSVLIALAKVRVARKLHQPEEALKAIDDATTPTLSPYHKSNLLMLRGRVLEEMQQYDEAWHAWEEGNKLHAEKFQLEDHVKLIDNIINTSLPTKGLSDQTQPVFIVGMFRSGTTLLEQILGAHPDIDAAGEVNQILQFVTEKPYPDCITNPIPDWPKQYLQRIHSDAKFCTDKMPMNYLHVGLIHTIFPKAKIIHTTRNALDTCVSCFANSFAATHAYTSNLRDLAYVYKQYIRIMTHWNETLPNRIHEVRYELLVDNLEETIKTVLEHIGVNFDPACLEFYNVRGIAVTPSADQVRKPIYKSSVKRHKHFERHLDELTSLQ